MNRYERECFRTVVDAGFTVIETRKNKHLILKCVNPQGKRISFAIPCTPSCGRSARNFAAEVRRAVR